MIYLLFSIWHVWGQIKPTYTIHLLFVEIESKIPPPPFEIGIEF